MKQDKKDNLQNANPYADMLFMERPASVHPKMSAENRAAQFSPFAALSGFEDKIEETRRQWVQKLDQEYE